MRSKSRFTSKRQAVRCACRTHPNQRLKRPKGNALGRKIHNMNVAHPYDPSFDANAENDPDGFDLRLEAGVTWDAMLAAASEDEYDAADD